MLSPESLDASPVAPRPLGVLVVDDDDGVRRFLSLALGKGLGFVTWQAAHGREALALYREHHPAIDMVLLDVRMPVLDGAETLAALQELNPRVRCCFLSGDLGRYSASDLYDRGAVGVLQKPFRLRDLVESLRDLTGDVGVRSLASPAVPGGAV
jgi:CheY-like chemotaxis protein